MAPRQLPLIAALTLPAILAVTGTARQAHTAGSYARLHIEALIPGHLQVRLTSMPPGLVLDSAQTDDVRKDVDVLTPAIVLVADSVRVLRIVTYGPRAVRLRFDSAHTAPGQRVPPWGRDITLVRQPNGYLQPVVRAHFVP
jgi:hypothetical protein